MELEGGLVLDGSRRQHANGLPVVVNPPLLQVEGDFLVAADIRQRVVGCRAYHLAAAVVDVVVVAKGERNRRPVGILAEKLVLLAVPS